MPHITYSVSPDPGADASDSEKMAYYLSNSNTLRMVVCVQLGIKMPLEVSKRSDNGGVTELYFVDQAHMCYFYHKTMETDMNAECDTICEKVQAGEIEAGNDIVTVLIEHGEPMRVIWQYPTYSALVSACYKAAQKAGEVLTAYIESEAQQEAETQAQLVSALLAAQQRAPANNNLQHLMASMTQTQDLVTQSIQNSAMQSAQTSMAVADAFGPTVCKCYRNLGYNCHECKKWG